MRPTATVRECYYVILLIATQVSTEWVEISQQHYRKPLRTYSIHNSFTTPDKIDVEETTNSWYYNNRTVTEYNWHKSTLRQSYVGNIKRIQNAGNNLKPIEAFGYEDNYPYIDSDEFELKHNHEPIKLVTELSENIKQKGTVERVPNVANVKRIQLNNSPVKSPVVNVEDDIQLLPKTRYEELPIDIDQKVVELFKDKKSTETKLSSRRIYINKIVNNYTNEVTSTFPSENEPELTEEVQVVKKYPKLELKNRTKIKHVFSTNPTFVTETEDSIQNDKHEETHHKTIQSSMLTHNSTVSKKKHIFTAAATENTETVRKRNEELQNFVKKTVMDYRSKNIKDQIGDNINQSETEVPQIERNYRKDIINNEKEKIEKDSNVKLEQNENNNIQYTNQGKEKVDKTPKENKTDNKVHKVESLLKVLKVVADTLSQNTQRSFGGKLRYLHELKDSILNNIVQNTACSPTEENRRTQKAGRIEASWPDDDVNAPHRSSRSAHASSRGHHVAFPSSESALMTISFLTFAVFLIKLVLQVIHTYKNKAMMVAPVVVAAAGRTSSAHRGMH